MTVNHEAKNFEHLLIMWLFHFAAVIPAAVLEHGDIQPFRRGFFCDDDSIKYPHRGSTVPSWAVGVFGLLIPAITVSFRDHCIMLVIVICTMYIRHCHINFDYYHSATPGSMWQLACCAIVA